MSGEPKKPQNTLIFCGLALFRLLLAGTFSSLQPDCSNLSDPLSGDGGTCPQRSKYSHIR